jgi:secreted PhoX family phosphatase
MNLSRRGFLKSLLATSALAPIAPALVEAMAPATLTFDKMAAVMDAVIEDALTTGRGYWAVVVHPGWSDTIAEWKREAEFYRREQWGDADSNPLFEDSMSYIDGMRIFVNEEEPIAYKHIEPRLIIDEIADREGQDHIWAPTRRVTREQLLSEGFTRSEPRPA